MIAPPIRNLKKGPEAIIQEKIVDFLHARGWYVMQTHGNLFQSGFPDLYAMHSQYCARWIEVKQPVKYSFTQAQLECFPKMSANGTGIWIMTEASESEYAKLFSPANWYIYLVLLNQDSAYNLKVR